MSARERKTLYNELKHSLLINSCIYNFYHSYCVILYVPRDFIAPFTLACATAVILVATPMKKS